MTTLACIQVFPRESTYLLIDYDIQIFLSACSLKQQYTARNVAPLG